jgi:hypothetical protein
MLLEKNIFGKTSYDIFYRHSDIRQNLLGFLKFQPASRILMINEGKTCLVGMLEKQGCKVTRATDRDAIRIADQQYDVIVQIGELPCGEDKAEVTYKKYFSKYKELLSGDGMLIVAVQNRLGLKYFAGCKDDNTGEYFSSLEGYPKITQEQRQALSKKKYEWALRQAGFQSICCYYPYPDYQFPMSIYSDKCLPKTGELNANIRNFNADRYVIFDETRVFNSIIQEEIFPEFSNSYLYLCRQNEKSIQEEVIYSKFSNERQKKFQIRTDIVQKENDVKYVVKYPLSRQAKKHIANMEVSYQLLSEENGEKMIHFCPVHIEKEGAVSPFANGVSLQVKLQNLLDEKKYEEAEQELRKAIEILKNYLEKRKKGTSSATDLDMVFSNILVEEEQWNIIDYEWTFLQEIPSEFVIYRALLRASIELPSCELTCLTTLLDLAQITTQNAEKYFAWEREFQNYITGKQIPARDMVELLGNQVIPFKANKTQVEKKVEELLQKKKADIEDLCFHIDSQTNCQGRMVCSGWAYAAVKDTHFIPVYIDIVDSSGQLVEGTLERKLRPDVKAMLPAREDEYEIWGFDISWTAKEDQYALRFYAGKFQKTIELTGAEG